MALQLSCSTYDIRTLLIHNNISRHSSLRRSLKMDGSAPKSLQVKCNSRGNQISPSYERRSNSAYKPTTWTYDFLQSLHVDHADETYKKRAKELEEELRFIMKSENDNLLIILELIDDIQRLGLGHRFEKDIKENLDRVMFWKGNDVKEDDKLQTTAIKFRLLRQNGYFTSQDVFKPFIDKQGNFTASLHKNDVKGMLSLYEAANLGFEGENLMDKALLFSKTHLHQLKTQVKDQAMHEIISHALELPLHHRVVRLEARWQIEAYSKRKHRNLFLLELAVLEFNMVQSVLVRDLQDMSRWWKEINLANKLEFARDRLMECFFWTVGMFPQPQYSNCRKVLTKVTSFITTIDDIYDEYGSLEELELFTTAIERWDVDYMKDLPNYMKLCFLALYNTVNEIAYDILKEHEENVIPYLKKAWVDMSKAFLQEAKWKFNKDTPKFKDYLVNGLQSISGVLILVHSYFLVNQSISQRELELLENQHNMLHWPSLIFRLCNDLATSKAELERGETANSISCNMHDTGVSEELAREHIRKLISNTWKNMNEQQAVDREHQFSMAFIETTINLARIAQCTYQYGDGHGAPDARANKRVLLTIIEPISFSKEK